MNVLSVTRFASRRPQFHVIAYGMSMLDVVVAEVSEDSEAAPHHRNRAAVTVSTPLMLTLPSKYRHNLSRSM